MKVLDLDMDYFMEVIAETPFSVTDRLEEEYYGESVWSENRIRSFLENNLGLSKDRRIEGRIVCGHNEAWFFWEELLADGKLSDPFEVVHVDSHADLAWDVLLQIPYKVQCLLFRLNRDVKLEIMNSMVK